MSWFNRPKPVVAGAQAEKVKILVEEALGHWSRVMGSDEEVVRSICAQVSDFDRNFKGDLHLKAILMSGDPIHAKFMQVLEYWSNMHMEKVANNDSIPSDVRWELSGAAVRANGLIQGNGSGNNSQEAAKSLEEAEARMNAEVEKGFDKSPEKTARLLITLFREILAYRLA